MSSAKQRLAMAKRIFDFEARIKDGKLQVYKLLTADGGGEYEVAGINNKYHPTEAKMLKDLIEAGNHKKAQDLAIGFIATYTDNVAAWTAKNAIESYLRDCAFNRGARGAALILQKALGVEQDGIIGQITITALRAAEKKDAKNLLTIMRKARELYEREKGRDESSIFWKGLVNRWNNSLDFAKTFLT